MQKMASPVLKIPSSFPFEKIKVKRGDGEFTPGWFVGSMAGKAFILLPLQLAVSPPVLRRFLCPG